MKIEARNLLAESILEALDSPETAVALRCLAAYCSTTTTPPVSVSIEALSAALPTSQTTGVTVGFRRIPLLSWERSEARETATLVPSLTDDYASTVAKLTQYASALTSWVPNEQDDTRTTALRKAVQLFNGQLFFEVHEVLEDQWKQEEGEVRRFLQGLIQIAVAFHHLGNCNFRGAIALLHDGLGKIRPSQPEFLGIELQQFVARLRLCQQELQTLGPEHFQRFSPALIPSLQFVA